MRYVCPSRYDKANCNEIDRARCIFLQGTIKQQSRGLKTLGFFIEKILEFSENTIDIYTPIGYNNKYKEEVQTTSERRKTMARKKKNGNQNKSLEILVLITAILNLIKALVDIIGKFLE